MSDQVTQSRIVRRRNPRPINSCIECRQRKSRCSKTSPCQNCTAFGRNCVFITIPETQRRRPRESISRSSADWTQPLPLRTLNDSPGPSAEHHASGSTTTPGTPPRDYEWEAYQQDIDVDDDAWAKLPLDPEAAHDGVYEDEDEDWDVTEFNLQIGRMVLVDRVGAPLRPQYAEELGRLLSNRPKQSSSSISHTITEPSTLLSSQKVPCPSPSLSLLLALPASGSQTDGPNDVRLPTRVEAETLYQIYLESVNPIAHVLHIPSFKRLFDTFWVNVELGNPNSVSSMALVLAVCMAAASSLTVLQSKTQFGLEQEDLARRLQTATEQALIRANWTKTSNIRTLQAFTIYLMPLCRAQVSRTTSVLVGALIRLAQCIGIHRASHNLSTSLNPLQRHVRSLLWHQICFLDVKSAESQGPLPSIRTDEFDISLPLNVDDDAFEFGTPKWQPHPVSVQGWTDATFSIIRYECNEIHRLIFRGRTEMDRNAITLHDIRAQVESHKRQIHSNYLRFLDPQIPIQRCAGLVATLLLSRCDSMLLYRHLPQNPSHTRTESENRLRDVLITAALMTLETGATLETLPSLNPWAWYASSYQQYNSVLLLLSELYRTPDLPKKDRMFTIMDHVFGHCYGVGVQERCGDILWAVKENLEVFFGMRGAQKRRAAQGQANVVKGNSHSQFGSDSALGSMNAQPHQPMGALDVDLDSLLQGFGNVATADAYEDFLPAMPSTDTGAIFVPADSGIENDWLAGGANEQNPPLQQRVSHYDQFR
ncbi:uncharacterized protein BDZ99DRAFT_385519 [Mytilinidion resinicola]|uniref:Zn(2)-C6 fungal-type domain-containing protein n=1 Tax=Mytilinidion resinicola TaxID=574789 RepID=A0A6A6YRS9_9PEZI|nr:uncharacterized protein BDZ99DRAFT_385519 [Mytilinidion resinicola]KAF2811073.1 hypothetical protein BDZ99DRAFT_385519 [Mytilinidion resinicola]